MRKHYNNALRNVNIGLHEIWKQVIEIAFLLESFCDSVADVTRNVSYFQACIYSSITLVYI